MFKAAAKQQLKARVALCGPTGSGKTWTGLQWATVLADGGRICVIDTENSSASYYADRYQFDVYDFQPPYDPTRLVEVIKAAETEGYAVVLIDSLSHFWEGEGGTLDIADNAGQRNGGNSFAGWKVATPALRHLIDSIRGSRAHVIATMRSKMEYVLEVGKNGKTTPRRIGMAPVMRAGVEYEFTAVGDMDLEHRLMVTKSRCEAIADMVAQPGRAGEIAEAFKTWLESGEALADRASVENLVAAFDVIANEGDRKKAKAEFVAEFGKPDQITATRYDDAAKWIDSYFSVIVPTKDNGALL
jgi:hypothetical protein